MASQTFLLPPFLLVSTMLCFTSLLASAAQHDVVSYGAIPDGKTDSTKSFVAAWTQACGSEDPTTIYVPKGRFSLRNVVFKGPCKNSATFVRIDGTLVAPSDYNVIGSSGYWVFFQDVKGITVSGGTLDGQGEDLWACKASGMNCPIGAPSMYFANSSNIVISGLTSLNSQFFHIVVNGCQNVRIQGVQVSASGTSPNTDGIHVELSRSVTILNSRIATGDDCVSVGPGTTDVWIENIACGPGHGISIGSLGKELQEPGVNNVTVRTATFVGTQNGVRIKSWGRPSNSYAKNIVFQHCTMINVQNPILIDQNYCPNNKDCPGQVSGVRVSDVTYQDIHGSSATEVAVKLDCSKKYPCSGIKMEDVKLTYQNQPAEATCLNAGGTNSGLVQPASCL